MKITSELTDAAVLQEIGARLGRRRIDAGLTQARLAEEAGVSKRTVERLEAGESTDCVMLLRVLRALKLLEGLEQLLPDRPQSPLALLGRRGRVRKRVAGSRRQSTEVSPSEPPAPWKWRE
ncbi:MAG TPA: helix-turn-helix domain-containing protein [Steroidobacteraceae bacterium]|nr:helix-turn-helix domain-containing protein [Steroidobacteraceae bacterium]